ncbi:MAG TPA: hypothetical protein VFM56_01005, partial [Solimonas sp.]|nr:hypothetical protein [Solimonas sp.]
RHGWRVGDDPEHVSSAGSARAASGAVLWGVLSFAYFSLHKQRKVSRAAARNQMQNQELQWEVAA